MKRVVTLLLFAASVAACTFLAPCIAAGEPMKPLAVVSVAGYDEVVTHVEFAGQLIGRPKLARGFQGMLAVVTQGKGLAGVDKTRPWGVVLQTDGSRLAGYAFLPVDDLDALGSLAEPYIQRVDDLGDGRYEVQLHGLPVLCVKHAESGWLFVSDKMENLAGAPGDPTVLLGGLPEQYTLAVRLEPENVPAQHRDKLIEKMRRDVEKDLQRRPGESEHAHAVRTMLASHVVRSVRTTIEDADTITLGLAPCHAGQGAAVDLTVTAKAGSQTARLLNALSDVKTDFAAFAMPGAISTGRVTATCPYAASADLGPFFDAVRAEIFKQIDANEPNVHRADVAKDIVGGLIDVTRQTTETGRADGALSVIARDGTLRLVTGRNLAGGATLDATFRKFVDALRRQYPIQVDRAITTDVDRLGEVRFHAISIDVPPGVPNRREVVRVIGERLEAVVGIADDRAYLATGPDALETLKQAIGQSAALGGERVAPMTCSVDLGELSSYLADHAAGRLQRRAARARDALAKHADSDRVKVTAEPVENGLTIRLEVEPGVLSMIEAMHRE
jgi:hypothetical protein